MLYKNIMVAYDGSEPSREAIVVAKDLIDNDADATLHVVSIISIGSLGFESDSAFISAPGMQQIFPDMTAYDAALEGAKESALKGVDEVIEELLDGVPFSITRDAVVAVKPAEGICEYAEDKGVDMIVMGRRGLGAFRAMLGSVSYAVLHETSIPVVTVK